MLFLIHWGYLRMNRVRWENFTQQTDQLVTAMERCLAKNWWLNMGKTFQSQFHREHDHKPASNRFDVGWTFRYCILIVSHIWEQIRLLGSFLPGLVSQGFNRLATDLANERMLDSSKSGLIVWIVAPSWTRNINMNYLGVVTYILTLLKTRNNENASMCITLRTLLAWLRTAMAGWIGWGISNIWWRGHAYCDITVYGCIWLYIIYIYIWLIYVHWWLMYDTSKLALGLA